MQEKIDIQGIVYTNQISELFPCQCGCGELTPLGIPYIQGHDEIYGHYRHWVVDKTQIKKTPKPKPESQLCECGCGEYAKPGYRFIYGHQNRNRKYLKGDYLADAQKRQYENMRGGNDIVEHHYLYDHSDLSLNTIKITRSDHTQLHNLLLKLCVRIPHINIRSKL